MKLRKFVSVFSLSLMLVGLYGNFRQFDKRIVQACPDSELHFWANKETIPLPDGVTISTYDLRETSYGLFVTSEDGKIYRTRDDGQTWDIVYTWGSSVGSQIVFKTQNEWIIVRWLSVMAGTNFVVSKDEKGESWQLGNGTIYGFRDCMLQLPNGTIYTTGRTIKKSNDAINWATWKNISQVIVDLGGDPGPNFHSHALAYDPLRCTFYFAGGDDVSGTSWAGNGKVILYTTDDGNSWNGLDPNRGAGVGRVATKEGIIWGLDYANVDLHKTWYGNSTNLYLTRSRSPNLNKYIGQLELVNEVVYVATRTIADNRPYGLYASPDYGRSWLTILEETGDGSSWISYGIRKGEDDNSLLVWRSHSGGSQQLWRMFAPSQGEVLHEIKRRHISVSGNTYTFEKDVGNDSLSDLDYVDLSRYSVKDAKIKLTGVSYMNHFSNPSFEDGENDWAFTGDGTHGTVTSQKKYGSYSLSVNKTESEGTFTIYQSWFDVANNDYYLASFWVRANVSAGGYLVNLQCNQKNNTGQTSGYNNIALSSPSSANKWERRSGLIKTNKLNNVYQIQIRIQLKVKTATSIGWHLDGFVVEHVNRARSDKQHSPANPSNFFEGTENTTDVSLTIGGEAITYTGELADGTETSETSLPNLAKTGIATISSIQVSGSGAVKITIIATIEFQVANVVLREKSGDVYIGRRYNDTMAIPTAISSIICISDGKSNITEASLSGDLLSLTISAWSGQQTSTKVYCGDQGEPRTVSGADSWSYDGSTKICTIALTHSSSSTKTVTLEWGKPIPAAIDIEPDVLRLKSKGKWIKAYITLPEGYDVSDTDFSSILVNDSIPVDPDAPSEIGDYDEDGIQDLMLKFNRQDLIAILPVGEAKLTITGKVNDTPLEGTDTILVIGK